MHALLLIYVSSFAARIFTLLVRERLASGWWLRGKMAGEVGPQIDGGNTVPPDSDGI